jgi:DNA-binding IclR family transcriptional regulator
MSNISDEPQASAARRTLELVELLLASPDGLPPHELLIHLEVSRSTLFSLLSTLKQLGYVEQAERRGRYRPGPRLRAWRETFPAFPSADLSQAFYQETERREWPETLALAFPSPAGPLVLAQVEGSQRVRASLLPGQADSRLSATASVLAADPPDAARANGYVLATSPDMVELALPICRDGRRPDSALLLAAPAFRWQPSSLREVWLPELRAMAARLSYRMGASFYAPYQLSEPSELQPTTALTTDEVSSFLSGPWTARLGCIRPDGRPHVVPVWQEWDGLSFTVIAWRGSQWASYLRQNANVSLTVDEPWPPLRRVTCRGLAQPLDPAGGLDVLARRLARRYLGSPAAMPGELEGAFRILPDSLRGYQGLS